MKSSHKHSNDRNSKNNVERNPYQTHNQMKSFLVLFSLLFGAAVALDESKDEFHTRMQATWLEYFRPRNNKEVQAWWIGVSDPDYGDLYWIFGDEDTVSIDDHLYIGSISKTFGATAALLLAEQGAFSLDNRIEDLAPELNELFPEYAVYTIADLLGMQTLIPDFLTYVDPTNPDASFQVQYLTNSSARFELLDIVNMAGGGILKDPPFDYSNTNYVLLEYVIETVTGTSMPDLVEEMVLLPLGLSETAEAPRDSTGVLPEPKQGAFAGDVCYSLPFLPGIDMGMLGVSLYSDLTELAQGYVMTGVAAGMYSTVPELLEWAMSGSGDTLLSPATVEERHSYKQLGFHDFAYGFGQTMLPSGWYGHQGSTYGSESWALKSDELQAAFVSHTDSCFFRELHDYAMETYTDELTNRTYGDSGAGSRRLLLAILLITFISLFH